MAPHYLVAFIAAIIVILVVFVTFVALIIRRQNDFKRKRDEFVARQHTDRAARKLRDQRYNLGGRIFNAIQAAARQNPTGIVTVWNLPNNGQSYSIVVKFNEPGVYTHLQATFQVNVNYAGETGKELHVLEGNYGPEHFHPATEVSVESLLPWLKEKTSRWGVDGQFPKKKAA